MSRKGLCLEGVMNGGSFVRGGFFCPEENLSTHNFPTVVKHDICYGWDSTNVYFIHINATY